MGPLKDLLGFSTGIITAGKHLLGMPSYGNAHASQKILNHVQTALNAQGYTGFEYLGYFMFFRGNEFDRRIIRQIHTLGSDNILEEFFKFKESRASAVQTQMQLIEEDYRRYRDAYITSREDVFDKVQANCGYKAEVLMRYAHDFSEDFVRNKWALYGYGIGEKFRITPEMLVACTKVASLFKSNGGENGFTKISFSPITG